MQTELIVLLISILLSGFFSGIEVAFFSLSKVKVNQIVKSKQKHAKSLEYLKNHSNKFIITVLIGNNIVNILSASVATKLALDIFGNTGIAIATGVMTFFILIFGEIIPKAYCSRNAEKIGLLSAPIILFMSKMLLPVIFVLEKFTQLVLKIMGSKVIDHEMVDERTLKELIQIGEEAGHIKSDEREMITNVFEFDDTTVENVMIAKEQTITAQVDTSAKELLKIMTDSGYSRIPVYEDDPSKIIGVIHIKQLIGAVVNIDKGKKSSSSSIKSLLKEPYFVPETKKINSLFKGFQRKQVHMAVVVNEYGSFEGLVTLEDVIEQLVGEVYDETDVDESAITKINGTTFIVKGDCLIEDLNKKLRTRFNESEFDTINGLIVHELGRIPIKTEVFKYNSLQFTVVKADKTHVKEFRVEKLQKTTKLSKIKKIRNSKA